MNMLADKLVEVFTEKGAVVERFAQGWIKITGPCNIEWEEDDEYEPTN